MLKKVIVLVLFFAVNCFASETVEKISDYEAKITVTNIVEKDDTKTTLSQEKNFSLSELQQAKNQSTQSLKSWVDKKVEVEKNITIQTEQVAMWDRLIAEAQKQGIKEEPKEVTILSEEAKVTPN